ncbi:hypothetical protein P7228_00005 [Altererythrobacter arenosus]|uniref:Cadherin domain-containing protein n=1 Tax=Altererythrobacter arenosus TaxID=3032592 RepID=A0ABY8FTC3_9SPHN|nr:hypothetical protein [Altererythrobacter sp. CAU 1644]WFL77485.1 hypothetical protein P7228_00005 [Altererythrobacter sp. CAU 1644]
MRKYIGCSAITLSFMLVAPAHAQSSTVTLTAEFSSGAIAEYSNGPNRTSNAQLFSPLSISSITISQESNDGNWGGSQGNDTAVTATITYANGSTLVFPAAINWVKNTSGGGFDWIGLTTSTNQNDGYTAPGGGSKTYILQFPQSSLNLSTLLPDSLDGSANSGGALNALNLYFPGPGSSSLTFTSSSAFSYLENSGDADVIGTVQTANAAGAVTYSITSGNANGWYEINPTTGQISLTPAGVAAAEPNDFETTPNSRTITVQANDGSDVIAQTITLSETDVAEGSPISFTSGNAFSYAENSADSDVLASIAATGGTAALTYAIIAGDPNGWYEIDPATGAISLTPAGVAAEANDFETGNPAHVLTVQASDGLTSASMDITLTETDLDDTAPVISGPSGGPGDASSTIDVDEGTTAVTTMSADEGVTWSIIGGTDSGDLAIDPATGAITFNASPDFEAPVDSDTNNSYVIVVQAEDAAGNTSTQTLTVNVLDLDDTAPTITSAASFDVNEGVTSVATLTANETVTWSITGGVDAGDLAIDPTTGAITFNASPDFEAPVDSDTNNSYVIEVTATDAAGNTTVQTVTVNVLDLPEGSPISFTSGNAFSYAENSADSDVLASIAATGGTAALTYAIIAGDPNGWYEIDPATGAISLTPAGVAAEANDFETGNPAHVLTVQASDGLTSASMDITLTETDLDDTAPVISGPSGGPGDASSTIDVDEGTTAVTTMSADEGVTWSIIGGTDSGDLAIDPATGAIAFNASPDFEAPVDSDTNNSYVIVVQAEDAAGNTSTQTLTVNVLDLDDTAPAPVDSDTNNSYVIVVQAEDAAGNTSTQTLTVNVLDLDDTAPVISGPSGGPGAGAGEITVDEGTTTVTQLTSDEPVTWSITGGNDQGLFSIAPDGTISFVTPPDYEAPTDSDGNNTYILTVEAIDGDGNISAQTITVTVANLDDTAPKVMLDGVEIQSGEASFEVVEGTSNVSSFASNENVIWTIVDGDDQGQFSISNGGELAFQAAPDFEAPTDLDGNNVYLLAIEATDDSGNVSRLLLDVTVLDQAELQQRVDEISGALRQGLRTHALVGLSDLLSYNEELMVGDFNCSTDRQSRNVSGSLNANETAQNANVRFQNALTACGKNLRMLLDGGATITRLDGNSRVRSFASLRIERNLSSSAQLGLNVIGSTASDSIDGFADSDISDFGLTGQVYGRFRLDDDLMAGAFVGYGQSWYNFDLQDESLRVEGDYTGERFIVGGMVRGEIAVGQRPLTIDGVLSYATESLGNARFAASLDNEDASDLTLALGDVQSTRISVPLTYSAFGPLDVSQAGTGLNLTAGGLCESEFSGSGLDCGFQAGGRLWRRTIGGSYAYLDIDFENAAGLSRFRIDAGYAFDIGLGDGTSIALNLGTVSADRQQPSVTGLITLATKR